MTVEDDRSASISQLVGMGQMPREKLEALIAVFGELAAGIASKRQKKNGAVADTLRLSGFISADFMALARHPEFCNLFMLHANTYGHEQAISENSDPRLEVLANMDERARITAAKMAFTELAELLK